jgi:hypothetical protein
MPCQGKINAVKLVAPEQLTLPKINFITRLKSWYRGRPDRRISNSSKQQKSLSLLDASSVIDGDFVLAKEAKIKR